MKNSFAIGIPTINRYDLLRVALKRYAQELPSIKIYIIDNGRQGILNPYPNVTVFEQKENLGVSESWNRLCKEIFYDHDYALILNDDIELGKTEEEIDNLIEQNKDKDFIVGTGTWCAFILPKETFWNVGEFNTEFFPAYYEDNDFAYRMKLLNLSFYTTKELNPIIYRNSMTIERDSSLNNNFEKNKALYKSMWGGEPGNEIFTIPFNGKTTNVLNIITPVSRTENLWTIYKNLINNSEGLLIIWWLVFDKSVESSIGDWDLIFKKHNHANVLVSVLLSDKEKVIAGHYHRNIILNSLEKSEDYEIIKNDWCYNLDDDNILHPLLTSLIANHEAIRSDVILFSQALHNNALRLKADKNNVEVCHVDTAMILFRISAIQGSRFIEDDYCADGHFIKAIWNHCDESTRKVHETAHCFYNYLK